MSSSNLNRWQKLMRKSLIVITVCLIALLLMQINTHLIQSDRFFVVRQFEIHGTKYLTHRDVVTLSKVKVGDQLLKTDLDKVAQLIARSPYVKNIVVEKRLPSNLYIVINEREPITYINSEPLKLLSSDAVVLPRPVDFDYPDLPIVVNQSLKKAKDGDKIKNVKVLAALSALTKMKRVSSEVYQLVSDVTITSKQTSYRSILGGAVLIIPEERLEQQLLTFHYFLDRMKNKSFLKKALYIDLRFENRVIIKDRQKG